MLTIVYRFHVLPRRHNDFRHAWSAAADTFKQVIGLHGCEFQLPELRREPFKLILNWHDKASFARFTRTWVGVWAINGMGLAPRDFFASTQTSVLPPDTDLQQRAACRQCLSLH